MNIRMLIKYWRTILVVAEMNLRQQMTDGFILFTIKNAPNGLRYRRPRRKRTGNRKLLKLGKRAESQPSGWLRSSVRCWGARFARRQFTHEGP